MKKWKTKREWEENNKDEDTSSKYGTQKTTKIRVLLIKKIMIKTTKMMIWVTKHGNKKQQKQSSKPVIKTTKIKILVTWSSKINKNRNTSSKDSVIKNKKKSMIVSLFNGISIFMGYLMPKPSLKNNTTSNI